MRMVALLMSLLAVASTAATAMAEIPWQNDLKKAHMQAQAEGKPLLLHFYTDNCIYCDKLEAGAFQNPNVQQAIQAGFVPVKIHAGKQRKLAAMFKVSRFPTDVVVTTQGDAMSHRVSPQKPGDYVQMLAACAPAPSRAGSAIAASPAPPAPRSSAPVASQPSYVRTNLAAPSGRPAIPGGAVAQTAATESPGMPLPNFDQPVTAKAVSAKSSMTLPPQLGAPQAAHPDMTSAQPAAAHSAANGSPRTTPADADMELSMDGYCSVTLLQESQWVRGKPEFGVVHLGKLYLFVSEGARDQFIADPIAYTPMLNGIDVVRFFEEHRIVAGKREHCVIDPDHSRIYMFADEDALEHFDNDFDRYLATAMKVMDKAVQEANPR